MYIGGYTKVSLSPQESTAAACAFSSPRAGLITVEAFVLFAAGFHWVSFDVACEKVDEFAYRLLRFLPVFNTNSSLIQHSHLQFRIIIALRSFDLFRFSSPVSSAFAT